MGTIALRIDDAANGGLPKPLEGQPIRTLAFRHEACGTRTRIQVPKVIPASAVRIVTCEGCGERFEAAAAASGRHGLSLPRLPRLSLSRPTRRSVRLPSIDPSSRVWQLASIPVAALLVVGGLTLLQSDSASVELAPAIGEAEPPAAGPASGALAKPAASARVVNGSSFTLALPAGWRKVDPPAGATFAAEAAGGGADATLWIEEKPNLDFATFISRSTAQIEALTGARVRVDERIPGPTPESTIVRLAADSPEGEPAYAALLRVSGPYRYYLATTVEPGAGRAAANGVKLIEGSFVPDPNARGAGKRGAGKGRG